MLQVANILLYLSNLSVLIPIFFFIRKKQHSSNIIKVLGVLLLISATSDLIALILKTSGKPSTPVVNIYFFIQFFLLSFIYHKVLNSKKIIHIALFVFTAFFVFNIIFLEALTEYQSWSRAVGCIILILYALGYYYQLFEDAPMVNNLFKSFTFWFNTAVFYYFGASFLIFLCRNYLLKTQPAEFTTIVWGFHNLNNIIKNILFAIAIYWAGVKQEEDNNLY